ncbi:FAD-dependent oxidoreductase [Pseudactinotalea terrae]|uniref:FAD-dependent oxidoreductase n=1 Tax=Pseudactinotalea terrae TaxID=1743262 RepID=UPI0012E197B3|nr:FAD-dependent oxidoreductase [Pseudactinotalea terrae]
MTRLVVIGNGMVGSRFVEEIVARDVDGRFDITVLGAEPYRPYNRVLLSEVVAGKVDMLGLELPQADERASVHLGTEVVAIDRAQRVVQTESSSTPYDLLVLATGAAARIPEVPGLDGDLPAGVHPLRTLDDAREIVAATANASRAVVVGGGVLGVEVTCGLVGRGLEVTLVHGGAGVMDRQLAPGAGLVAEASLARLGVRCWTRARTLGISTRNGRVASVAVQGCPPAGTASDTAAAADLEADLVVLAIGTAPACSVAAAAGLATGRGIRVGADLGTADPAIYAIGDCAEPPEGASGLIAQGWAQARQLATQLTGSESDPARQVRTRPSVAVRLGSVIAAREMRGAASAVPAVSGTDVVKLKAHGLDVVAMGVCGGSPPAPDHRVLRLDDAASGRHVEVVVAQGQLVGATCVGSPDLAADLVATYTRRTPVPGDPSMLFLRPVVPSPAVAAGPEQMPARATVCTCNSVSKGDIADSFHAGARSVAEVARATRATTGCGSCTARVCGLLDWLGANEKENADVTVG